MKTFNALILLTTQASVSSFTFPCTERSTTALGLFGGGKKDAGAAKKAPGMMDQLAMFKKAQEVAKKKQQLDEELKKMSFKGKSADGKVVGTFAYVPGSNPMDPQPDYEAQAFEFDDAFYESASPVDLSEAVKEAIEDGIKVTNEAVAEKYQALQEDLMEAFGGAMGGAPPS